MKIRLLLILLVGIVIASCESEYDKQLDKAKQLVDQEIELEASLPLEGRHSGYLSKTMNELQETILFHAHLSGNKEVFLRELRTYKTNAVTSGPTQDILISKYP